MINKLIIEKKLVRIETDIVYKAIEIRYKSDLYIENLLADDYIVGKKNGKVLIIRFNLEDTIPKELFNYNGYCNIYYAFLVDKDSNKHELIIKRPAITTWNTMNKKNDLDGTSKTQVWESLTTDYELMESNIRNDYVKTRKIFRDYDAEAKTYIQRYETTLRPSKLTKKDKNLTTLKKLQSQARETDKRPKKGIKKIRGTY